MHWWGWILVSLALTTAILLLRAYRMYTALKVFGVVVGVILLVGGGCKACNYFAGGSDTDGSAGGGATVQERLVPTPLVIRGTTPATMKLGFEFNIEADAPVLVEYEGNKIVYTPGKGCQQYPQPQRAASDKVFTDPKDPKDGHVDFRIYRLSPGEGACK